MDWPKLRCYGLDEEDVCPADKDACPFKPCEFERDLTADEAAEYLKENRPERWEGTRTEYFGIEYKGVPGQWCVGYYEDIWPEGYDLMIIAYDPNFKVALQNAARAVRSKG